MKRGKHFSRSNRDDGRDHIVSLLRATRFFLIDIRVGLFRGSGKVFTIPDHTLSDSSPSHARLPFQVHLPHILAHYIPTAGAIFLLPEPSQTFLLPWHLLFHLAWEAHLPGSLQKGFSLIIQISALMLSPQRCRCHLVKRSPPPPHHTPLPSPRLLLYPHRCI